MMQEKLVDQLGNSIRKNWNVPALANYQGECINYGEAAGRIARLHLIFEICQVRQGEKIALVGKNSVNWGITYLAAITWGAVIVPVLPDFKPNDIHHIVNHSDSRLLFVADNIFENLTREQMKEVEYIFSLSDFSLLCDCKSKKTGKKLEKLDEAFHEKYPEGLSAGNFQLPDVGNENLAVLSYTSGTTGFTKGVMLTHNNLAANVIYANKNMPLEPGHKIVSFLPLAHAYGCAFEFLWPFNLGCHITFLTKTPSPQIILKAFSEIKPRLVLAVPLIMEKIYKKQLLPVISKPAVQILLKTPVISSVIQAKVRKKLMDAFGGNFHEVVIGGAPLSKEVEEFLNKIKFPFSIGYGMTECGPLISYANWDKTRLGSAGKVVDTLEIKIDSEDPGKIAGEIMVKGENVMKGYYKNPQATKATLEPDGWMHTGDLGLIDEEGFVYIKGRIKSMILGASGKNIYPEEIEARLNNLDFVQESLVVEKNGRLVALIYPDYEVTDNKGLSEKDLKEIFEKHRKNLNETLPTHMSIASTSIFAEEFEKTPKKSIKRFLYDQVE
ncbi:MAG: long-chain fatty acid--CoA ligase [Bacteroidetes bacterium]|nr:MAG: long-chain fatty acid--CoA ligase [Bacteroidota bacterium]